MITLHHGDALDVLRSMEAGSVDAIVTDPPAGIGFMGKGWDGAKGGRDKWIASLSSILAEAFRVARPGARMFCWAIPRTCGWTQIAIEDAGWLVENAALHLFGSGFPKGKGQLKPAAEVWFLARKPGGKVPPLAIDACRVNPGELVRGGGNGEAAARRASRASPRGSASSASSGRPSTTQSPPRESSTRSRSHSKPRSRSERTP